MHYLSPEETFQYIPGLPKGNLMEFGVYNSNYMRRLIKGSIEQKNQFIDVWGFDSWKGLPPEQDGVYLNPDWPPGAFSILADYGLNTVEECMDFVAKRVSEYLDMTYSFFEENNNVREYLFFDGKNENKNRQAFALNLVPGFFTESLTSDLGQALKDSVSYFHIDCDLYISSKDCLNWVFKHKIAKESSLFRFDDWGSTPLWTAGNSKAFMGVTNKYEIIWSQLGNNVFIYNGQNKNA